MTITDRDAGLRLDRWLRRKLPQVTLGRLQKWLRTGQVRVDGRRAKGSLRLIAGQRIRIPPVGEIAPRRERPTRRIPLPVPEDEARALQASVLYRDDAVIVIDKPAGLAVQGGTRTHRHLDAMLDALRFGSDERPRLVHRLDRDTSGVLVLARTAAAARELTAAFRAKEAHKTYWAAVAGVPHPLEGRIALALAKAAGAGGERVAPSGAGGSRAVTLYRVVDHAGKTAAWLELEPVTGRTHQLRVHCAAIGVPVIGDGKYGGRRAFLEGIAPVLHLHARSIRIPRRGRGWLAVSAPLPAHMRATWRLLGFAEDSGR